MADVGKDNSREADGGKPLEATNGVRRFMNWGPDGISLEGFFSYAS